MRGMTDQEFLVEVERMVGGPLRIEAQRKAARRSFWYVAECLRCRAVLAPGDMETGFWLFEVMDNVREDAQDPDDAIACSFAGFTRRHRCSCEWTPGQLHVWTGTPHGVQIRR